MILFSINSVYKGYEHIFDRFYFNYFLFLRNDENSVEKTQPTNYI